MTMAVVKTATVNTKGLPQLSFSVVVHPIEKAGIEFFSFEYKSIDISVSLSP
jgi:hypothetical protein